LAREAFAWPEASVFFYSAGEAGVGQAFVEGVTFQARFGYRTYRNLTTGAWASRFTEVLSDKLVTVDFRHIWTDSTALIRANSGTAWNFAVSAVSPLQTGAFQIWSGVITEFQMQGQENGLWKGSMQFRAHDYSAI